MYKKPLGKKKRNQIDTEKGDSSSFFSIKGWEDDEDV
jgi:hypothetical protein